MPMQEWLDVNFGRSERRLYAYPCSVTDLGRGGPNAQLVRYEALLSSIGFRAARDSDGTRPTASPTRGPTPIRLRASAVTYESDDPSVAIGYVARRWRPGTGPSSCSTKSYPRRGGEGDASIRTHQAVSTGCAVSRSGARPWGRCWTPSCGDTVSIRT